MHKNYLDKNAFNACFIFLYKIIIEFIGVNKIKYMKKADSTLIGLEQKFIE